MASSLVWLTVSNAPAISNCRRLANRLVIVIELLFKVIRTLIYYILELEDLYVVLSIGIESAGVVLPCPLELRA